MNELLYNLLIHHKDDRFINCGFDVWCECEDAVPEKLLTGKNGPIAFKEYHMEENEQEYERLFIEEVCNLEEARKDLSDSNRLFLMTVDKSHRSMAELDPNDKKYQKYKFILDSDSYNSSFEWYPLGSGDQVKVKISSIHGNCCHCSVVKVTDRFNKSDLLITAGPIKERLNLDLQCMAGKTLIQADVETMSESVYKGATHQYLKMSLNKILLGGNHDTYWNNGEVFGKSVATGTQYMMWVAKPKDANGKRSFYSLSFTSTAYHDKKMSDEALSDNTIVSITADVYRITNKDAVILAVSRNPGIASRVYVSDLNKYSRWGTFVSDYIPLGFPVCFTLDVETGTKKHRLHVRGLNIKGNLKGRISNDTDAQNLKDRFIKKNVTVSPHKLKEAEQAMLVNSPEYAGWAYFSDTPQALINYSRHKIFTTEMKVPANVSIKGSTVRFNIKEALEDELKRIIKQTGKSEKMKICSICLGTVFLTTKGGYPVEYKCKDLNEEEVFRKNMFREMDFIIESVDDDWVDVSSISWFNEQILQHGLHAGDYFNATGLSIDDKNIWHSTINGLFDCIVLPETLDENELLRENDRLMLVGWDVRKKQMIAAAHPERFIRLTNEHLRVRLIRNVTPDIWLCSYQDKLLMMHAEVNESSVLHFLNTIYGEETYADAVPAGSRKNVSGSAGCIFNGIACGFDYSLLFSGKPIDIPIPLSARTPKVLYGDIILIASPEEMEMGPMKRVLTDGMLTDSGTMQCTRHVPQVSKSKTTAQLMYAPDRHIYKGIVIRTTEDSVIFDVDGNEVAIPDEHLHMEDLDHGEICAIFTKDTEWALLHSGDTYELSTVCPKRISRYTLLKKTGGIRRRRTTITQWIVKHECGAIAEASIEDFEYNEGDQVLLHSVGDEDGLMSLIEPDYTGIKIPLIFDRMEDSQIICHRADGITLSEEYVIPKESWSWYNQKHPINDMSIFHGCALTARVKEYDNMQTILDRKCLIRQNELLPDSRDSGIFQMAVAGLSKDGYILQQNEVKVTLPWKEVSLCDISGDELLKNEFLKKGELIDVQLTYNESTGRYETAWRSLPEMQDTARQWKMNIRSGMSFSATVHHIGHNVLYLDIEGIPMYITSAQLGLWEGDIIENHYEKGQYIECNLLVSGGGTFSVSIQDKVSDSDIPIIYSVHSGTLIRYISDDDLDCVVKFGKWVATVKEENLTWEPVAEGTKPYNPGATLPLRVENIDKVNMSITASVIKAIPQPNTGPSSEEWQSNPELRWFRFDKVNEKGHIYLKDEEGRPGIMFRGADYTCSTETLVRKMNNEGGCWLVVKGVKSYCNKRYFLCSYLQSGAIYDLENELKSLTAGEKLIKAVKIRKVSHNELLVSHGIALGKISSMECTGQQGVDLTQFFKVGEEIECVIMHTGSMMFAASVVEVNPNGFADLLRGITIGSSINVTICRCDDNGVHVQIYGTRLMGLIPCNEVSHNPERDHMEWAENRMGDFVKVKCIDIDQKTRQILFSRKQMLAEGIVE